jgi:hypothetical protein
MIRKLVRTPDELKAARHALGLSADGLARMLRVENGRTVRRWEAGERDIPGPVIVLMETAMSYLAKRALILQQLEELQSGTMRTGKSEGNKMIDDTAETIARLCEAKASYESALESLTRQPLVEGMSNQVHWYHLKRQTPKYDRSQKDDWSVPGEVSCEAALAYFEKHEGFSHGLELCEDGDLSAEFVLEKRELLRSQHGASQRLSAGELVELFFVRRRGLTEAEKLLPINYDAPASLHRWNSLEKKRARDAQMYGTRQIWDGTLAGCVKQFIAKPSARKPLYDIMVGEEAGVGKTILEPRDIVEIANRSDFPKGEE